MYNLLKISSNKNICTLIKVFIFKLCSYNKTSFKKVMENKKSENSEQNIFFYFICYLHYRLMIRTSVVIFTFILILFSIDITQNQTYVITYIYFNTFFCRYYLELEDRTIYFAPLRYLAHSKYQRGAKFLIYVQIYIGLH